MRIERRFTKKGQSPYQDIQFVKRSSEIRNPDGSTVFKLDDIDVPARWSQRHFIEASGKFRSASGSGSVSKSWGVG